ncbi:MAG: bifunctional (p)ppGpp synthetase/guanosine-3',5'-bis(diphosphate) 3'-pyrophosphohydrolase [Proteobacteria bacterium]|nr:bifunctional (p)ppGpp synthetase/guanosine-3',5'-bis(diphosphate) 3'-pyrophosphohydrolase [Pseudomonadota bacterium]
MTDLLTRARDYASYAHARINHKRKYTGQPYQVHLKSVVQILAQVTDDADMLAAAWLHDTVEDTEATHHQIEEQFGKNIAALVYQLTDISRPGDGNRMYRKALDRAHLAEASDKAKTIKLADVIDNTRDICKHDLKFARVYVHEVGALLDVLQGGDERLISQAQKALGKCSNKLGIELTTGSMTHADWEEHREQVAFSQRRTLRIFGESFTAQDIAEPLRSFDLESRPESLIKIFDQTLSGVFGVRDGGQVTGYVRRDDLIDDVGGVGSVSRAFARGQVLTARASLNDVVQVLTRYEFCFVSIMDGVAGVINRKDMEKPVVRMWLFGIVTMMEMNVSEFIRIRLADRWQAFCSQARLKKARELQTERLRLGQQVDLLDCLQLTDKAKIFIAAAGDTDQLGFTSKGEADKFARELEMLRNHLAHGQLIADSNWPQIVGLSRRLEDIIKGVGNRVMEEENHE